MRVAHCAGTPGSEGGATYTRTRVTPREGLGVGAEVPVQAVAQATGYRTCHGMGLGGREVAQGCYPGAAAHPPVLDLVSGQHRLSFAGVTTLRFSNQPEGGLIGQAGTTHGHGHVAGSGSHAQPLEAGCAFGPPGGRRRPEPGLAVGGVCGSWP